MVSIRTKGFALPSYRIEAVAADTDHLAIGLKPPQSPGSLVSLGWRQFVVVLRPDHFMAHNDKPVDLWDLRNHNWILHEQSDRLADYETTAYPVAGS